MPFQPGNKLSGSRKGRRNKRTVELQELCEQLGVTPAEVMLRTMAQAWELAEELEDDPLKQLEARALACQIAKDVAPYVHAKLKDSQVEVTGPSGDPVVVQIMRAPAEG